MSEPKDYQLAEKAFEAFYGKTPVGFNDLAYEYQMRWVEVVRAIRRTKPNGKAHGRGGKAWTSERRKRFKETMRLKRIAREA